MVGIVSFGAGLKVSRDIAINEAKYRLGTIALEKQKEMRKENRVVKEAIYGMILGKDTYELKSDGSFYLNGRKLK
ncbi:MAG: hypothetical protein V3U54_08485 [Thermodesulfobacteriota bacterium]